MKKCLYALLLATVSAALVFGVDRRGGWDRWEFASWNWRVAARAAPSRATEDIKLILLDQGSLDWAVQEMGLSWPWPREVYAPIIQFALRGGARAVAFDVIYSEHSGFGVADDETLGAAIEEGPPFTPAVFLGEGIGRFTQWPDYVPDRALPIDGLTEWLAAQPRTDVVMPRATFPIPEIATPSTLMADVKGHPDIDGIIRRGSLFRVFDGRAVPALGLAAYLAAYYQEHNNRWPDMRIEEGRLQIGSRRIPIDANGRAIFRYRGPSGTHQAFSAAQIIQSELRLQAGERPTVSPVVFENAYVFLGFSAPGLLDLRPTPLSPVTPGVEVHTTMLDNFLARDFARPLPAAWVWGLSWFWAGLAALGLLWAGKAWRATVLFILFMAGPWAMGFASYDFHIWWPVIPSSMTLLLSMIGGVVVSYALEGRQKVFIKGAFKHYLSPAVIEQIMQDPDQLKLGGERRTLSIFFSDLAGFSAISEKLAPQELTQLLNDYLSDMTAIILEEGGTLDKYEGDAIIAFWNAPLEQPDHALRAARTALRCQRKLAERRPEFKERTGVDLYMRVGVNTGEVVVGNMGSHDRFDYTVLGDAANLASRLEGANKAFGTATMVAESTWEGAKEALVGREIGRITVVGRKTPVRVYEVLGLPEETLPIDPDAFASAIQWCAQGQWEQAIDAFSAWPDDPLAHTYIKKCQTLAADPAAHWDGVWNLTEK